jgi:uncharacterized RDD family membrane protein YckC
LFENAPMCSFCESPLRDRDEREEDLAPIGVSTATDNEVEPEWRREVARRMDIYRARRRRYVHDDDSQNPLPFHAEIATGVETEARPARVEIREEAPVRAPRRANPAKPANRVEISIHQPELDFRAPDDRAHPQTALIPVASLIDRRQAGALDLLFLGVSYAGFIGLFHSLGGHVSFAKVDAAVYGIVFFILYAVYFSLFTVLGGATPGMQFRGLYVVRLDGNLPETRQLVWRSFGYVLSGGALLMGFLWSLWDEDLFTWHDRMSHTYVTSAVPLELEESFQGAARQTFAHK